MNIAKEQEQFIRKLTKLSASTKESYQRYLGLLLEWMKAEGIPLRSVHYNDLLAFVRHCKRKPISTDQLNRILHIVQQYFTLKQREKVIRRNPVVGLKVKGTRKKLRGNLLDRKTLDSLYEDYPVSNLYDQRNKVILGLLVYQGLTTGDLGRLKPEHVKLGEGKLYVPGSKGNAYCHKSSNSRVLELKASQILELKEYLEQVRPVLNEKTSEYLLISSHGQSESGMRNVVNVVSQKIRLYASHYKNVNQLRASVITQWLKEKDIRAVQYLAGHVRVTSTERYQEVRMEDLQQALDKFHPLK